ncbi:MAG: YihY/virulence factor BrkB family protein [Planctomycetota bacterium]|nr:MAG: YihY/virulence factor BrkB family protein [Planctomycetota bacterium]
MLAKIIKFLTTDIWRLRLKNYPPSKSFLIRQLRIIVLAIRGYAEDKCKFRASALTFFSLLSIVPVIALMFGIAKGFGLQEKIEAQIIEKMQGQEEIAQRIIEFSNSLLENAKGGFIAGIGVAFLLWAVIKLLSNIENSFNDIWGIKKGRSIGRKFSDYLSMMLICPILLVMSSSATVIVSTQISQLILKLPLHPSISSLVLMALKLLPYCTIWVIFSFVFIFMPNAKVNWRSGILAGIVAGTMFQLVQLIYINFQVGLAKYNAIYGSFAALPFFLLWLQISWLVVLFGAELSFAHQNVDTYEFEPDCLNVSHEYKRKLSLLVTHLLVKNFCNCRQPLQADEISQQLEIPVRLVRQILYELVESGILSEVKQEQDRQVAYQPACDADVLTVKHVIDALESRGNADIPVLDSNEFGKLSECLATFSGTLNESPANIALKDI